VSSDPMLSDPMTGRLSSDLLQALHEIRAVQLFPKGATLFHQGSIVMGVYLVEAGEARVLLTTGQNEKQLLEVAGRGTLLGLSETVHGGRYRTTAEAGYRTRATFLPRDVFLAFLREHGDFCMEVVRILSEDLHGLYYKFRNISAHPGRPRHRSLNEQLN
jgi:CRP-like cAMP-binding protein